MIVTTSSFLFSSGMQVFWSLTEVSGYMVHNGKTASLIRLHFKQIKNYVWPPMYVWPPIMYDHQIFQIMKGQCEVFPIPVIINGMYI